MNVFDYIIRLPHKVIEELYQDPWTCQAIFRSLPPVAKQYVVRLLFSGGQIESNVDSWMKPGEESKHKAAMDKMFALKVLLKIPNPDAKQPNKPNSNIIKLNPLFQNQLKVSVTEVGVPSWASDELVEKDPPTGDFLDNYSDRCWQTLLQFMIGSVSSVPSSNIIDLLTKTGLMTVETDIMRITNKGYQFLLRDNYTQIWTLLLSYIDTCESRNMQKKDVISFLFQLSFLTFGKCYPMNKLTHTQRTLLQDLREFGLVYQRKHDAPQFYPTRLAITLSTTTQEAVNDKNNGFLVIEPNYRVYAYTSSELQISIMSLFLGLRYRLPNLVMGTISRENIRAALMNGITADQIIHYLVMNAHPELKKRKPSVPETVMDQIRLWEQERNRVTYDKGALYDSFPSQEAFEKVVQYAKDMGVYVWEHKEKKMLMVTDAGHESIRTFIKKNFT